MLQLHEQEPVEQSPSDGTNHFAADFRG
jgi:hypothetical protein